ncbi:MAG: M50 family metallopeptidase [Campylobacterota bacterium]|nr:M50 family metallopeptidase [Campylobacterota bacterium]
MSEFYQLLLVSIIIKFIPIVRIPFKMLSTYFHELGHGLMAILTGGKIEHIVLNFDGSGLCRYSFKGGFYHFLISISGYITTSVVGYYIYQLAKLDEDILSIENLYIILVVLIISILLWVRDIKTFLLSMSIVVLFLLPVADQFIEYFNISKYTVIYIKLIGVYVMLDGLLSPFHLLNAKGHGDGADLASMTKIPEIFWILLWISIAGYFLYLAYLLG